MFIDREFLKDSGSSDSEQGFGDYPADYIPAGVAFLPVELESAPIEDKIHPAAISSFPSQAFGRSDSPVISRPGTSTAAVRAKMLEQQRKQYQSKKDAFLGVSASTDTFKRPVTSFPESHGEHETMPPSTFFTSRSRIYEPSSSYGRFANALPPVKTEQTLFAAEPIEEVKLDDDLVSRRPATQAVGRFFSLDTQPKEAPQKPRTESPLPDDPTPKPPATVLEELKRPEKVGRREEQEVQRQLMKSETVPALRPMTMQEGRNRGGLMSVRRQTTNVRQLLESAMRDMHSFLLHPLQRDVTLQCSIRRVRRGFNRIYPKYYLYTSEERVFLLAGKKRPGNRTSNYLMTMNENELKVSSPGYMGKVRSNFLGTEFTLYDTGANPKKRNLDPEARREELGVVLYQSNILGAKGPRKMRVLLPSVSAAGNRFQWKPENKSHSMLAMYKEGQLNGIIEYFNKPPKWNEHVQAFVLNFNGRVDKASVKNFQLIDNDDENQIYLQFGRVAENVFTLDFQWPFSPLQAFGIALSSLDSKLACE